MHFPIKDDLPQIVEVMLEDKTYVYPKLEYGKPNQDQEPLLDSLQIKSQG